MEHIKAKTNASELALRQAAAKGELALVRQICEENNLLNINAAGQNSGKTALHQAAIFNRTEIVEYLLGSKNIKLTHDSQNKTAFDYASGNFDIVRLLLRKFKISFPAPQSDLVSHLGVPFFLTLQKKLNSFTESQLLELSKIINPGSFYMGYTCLMLTMLFQTHLKGVSLLINAGEDPNTQMRSYQPLAYQNTPLHSILANENTNEYIIEFLNIIEECGKKINFTIQDDQGKTTLLLAAKIRRPFMVKTLLERGALDAIHIPDKEGRNVLHIACALGDFETVEILNRTPEFSSLIEKEDNLGRLPVDMLNLSSEEIKAILKSIYIDPNRDLNASRNGSLLSTFTPANKSILEACLEGQQIIKESILLNKSTYEY